MGHGPVPWLLTTDNSTARRIGIAIGMMIIGSVRGAGRVACEGAAARRRASHSCERWLTRELTDFAD